EAMSKSFRVGLFVVATLLMFGVGIFLIGDKRLLFTRTYPLKAEFQNVAGLGEGATVRVGGIHQGTVDRIELPTRADGKVTVVMNLRKGTRAVVKKDSVAAIRAEGLIGDEYVEISFGTPDGEPVHDNDYIRAEAPIQIADVVKKTDQLLQNANGAMENI